MNDNTSKETKKTFPCENRGWSFPRGHCAPPIGDNMSGYRCSQCPLRLK